MSDQLLVGAVHQAEHQLRSGEHGHEAGGLHEQVAQATLLLLQEAVGALHLLRPLQQHGLARDRLLARAEGDLLQPLQLGDVHRVLDDEGRLSRLVQERRVHRRPVADLEAAALGDRQGDGIGDQRDGVGLAGGDHQLERLAHPPPRLAGIGEHLEDAAADQLLAAALGHRAIGVVGVHEAELAVEHHVGAGQAAEQRLEIRLRRSGALALRVRRRVGLRRLLQDVHT